MKIAYCSDLHLEFRPLDTKILISDADVLVLAGDIIPLKYVFNAIVDTDNDSSNIIDFFDTVTNTYKNVIWIMGNHEYYDEDLSSISIAKQILSHYSNLHILYDEAIMIDDVKFIGGTMWTDLNDQDPITVMQGPSMLNDFRIIRDGDRRLGASKWLEMHYNFITMLHKEVTDKCVVITHHSPTSKTIPLEYRNMFVLNGLYVSRLEEIILKYDIKLWIHGHLHDAPTVEIGDSLVTSNTRGYPRESCFAPFEIKVVDVF